MNTVSHILGFPRIGAHRELKKAVEAYWRGELSKADLEKTGRDIRETHWKIEAEAGLSFVTVGDFSWYDHVLDTSAMLGVVPERFGALNKTVDLDTIFCMARGQAPNTKETAASEMTKWFNTNYHYIVPEFSENQTFQLPTDTLFKTIDEAQKLGHKVKPVILGPLSFLWLGKNKNPEFNPLSLLNNLLPIYNQIFSEFKKRNIAWVQVDEPILVLDLPEEWQNAFVTAYNQLNFHEVRCLLATYFGSVKDNLHVIRQLPVQGLHIDICSDEEQWKEVISVLPKDKMISLGVINGRNIWAADLSKALALLQDAKKELGERLWVGSSCSLLHVPVDLDEETELDQEIKNWLSFAKQKVHEIVLLANGLNQGEESIAASLAKNKEVIA